MKKLVVFSALAVFAAGVSAAPSSKPSDMKKCVDAHGKVLYYGDTVPADLLPKCKNVDELSKQGTTKKSTEYLTPEERKAMEAQEAAKKKDDRKALDQKRHDRALLATYSSEKEIDQARERNLKPMDGQIAAMQDELKITREAGARKQLQDQIAQKQKERDAVRARFDADKARFMELTGRAPQQPAK